MPTQKRTIKNRPKNEAEKLNDALNVFTEGVAKPSIHTYKRGDDTSVRGDDIKSVSVGIEDIDEAVIYYFKEVIRPYVVSEGSTVSIPVMYADPEKWKSAQKDGYYRDKEGRALFPVITVRRDNMEKRRDLTNKLDGNKANVYQVYEKKYTQKNQYDNFGILTNRVPVKEFYNVVVPDYYTVTYSCAIYVSYQQDLNKLIESIGFRSDSYWGVPNKFQFKATIDSFPVTTAVSDGEDRKISCIFTLTLNGYLTPNNIDKQLAANSLKSRSKTQVIFTMEAISGDLNKTALPMRKNVSLAATSFIPEGVTVYNTFQYPALNTDILSYINTNTPKKADVMTVDTATFNNTSFKVPPTSAGLPPTSVTDFSFFANGVFVPGQHIISFAESGSSTVLTINPTTLGYGFDSIDEIIGVGKFA